MTKKQQKIQADITFYQEQLRYATQGLAYITLHGRTGAAQAKVRIAALQTRIAKLEAQLA